MPKLQNPSNHNLYCVAVGKVVPSKAIITITDEQAGRVSGTVFVVLPDEFATGGVITTPVIALVGEASSPKPAQQAPEAAQEPQPETDHIESQTGEPEPPVVDEDPYHDV